MLSYLRQCTSFFNINLCIDNGLRWYSGKRPFFRARRTHLANPCDSVARTYREDLYASRRIVISPQSGIRSTSQALNELARLMNGEGIIKKAKQQRQFTKPTMRRNLERMASRKRRFDRSLTETIREINEIKRRLS